MTLKSFHIVFITFSTLLALACGAYCVWLNNTAGVSSYVAGAVCSFLAAVILVTYGLWFYRKMKRLRLIA